MRNRLCRLGEIHLDSEDAVADYIGDRFSREDLKRIGAFFTPVEYSEQLVELVSESLTAGRVVVDPACGAGSLLLAAARRLPLAKTVEETIQQWSHSLAGWDITPEFVRIARRRLVSMAARRHGEKSSPGTADSLLSISVADTMLGFDAPSAPCTIVLNPPFQPTAVPSGTSWGSGKATAAAIFLEGALNSVPPGTLVAALLPEVLRCGTRYRRFRDTISSLAALREEVTLGQFHDAVDVHVYLALYEVGSQQRSPARDSYIDGEILGRHFDVSVGAVVPHRHTDVGPWRRYITARSLPAWNHRFEPAHSLRFTGTVVAPPFVAIRRTSRPGQRRAIATVVSGKREVAVENHLIVARPRDGSMSRCVKLLEYLAAPSVDAELDSVMRCRHLTTTAIKHLRWSGA